MTHSKLPRTLSGPLRLALFLFIGNQVSAATPKSEALLPPSTVAYLSVADQDALEAQWMRTQIGQFAEDPSLKPFIEHLRDTIPRRLGNLEDRIGVSADDLQGVAGGELCWALVARKKGRAASVLLIDTAGNAENRDVLIAKIDAHLIEKKSKKKSSQVAGIDITTYEVPPDEEVDEVRTAAYFVRNDLLCVADNSGLVDELAERVGGDGAGENLAGVKAYTEVMSRCSREARAMTPDLRWFLKPFPFVDAMRTIRPRKREGDDRIQQLREQGFDAVLGVGGFVNVSFDEKHDFIHRTVVYAPPVADATDGKKYLLGMNILRLPNRNGLDLHNWTPRMIARYTTLNIDLLQAFDNVGTLFDSIVAGYDGAFDTAMERFEKDPFGPKIKFRQDIIACLGNADPTAGTRVCLMIDHTLPIDTESERFLTAIEVKPGTAQRLGIALGKYLEKDGYVQKILEGREIWEFQPEEEEDFDAVLGDGGLFGDEELEDDDDDRLLTRSAVCVTDGQLFIASDVEFLRFAFQQAAQNESLSEAFDYLSVEESLAKLAPAQRCGWSFNRTDESLRPVYVLLREGRMPESESFFGRLLNELLTSPDDQKNQLLRDQRIDGSELPSFELARRYFGPSGRSIRSDDDGWLITGVLLNKAAD
ncbi:MAG: hypothetical protein ACR2NU_15965 [Aeoliella sp.]